ncbi:MAG: hypothetical protein HOW73_26665 [Polyangiaceae bacterium]|nr:hypothetical protein [Polyangiaceae bacterium]
MPYYAGEVGPCSWVVLFESLTEADVEAFAARIEALGNVRDPRYVVLDIAHGLGLPTPLQRKRITTAVESAIANKGTLAGHALATNSIAARGVLTAINWFVERPFEEKIFSNPADALTWLASLNPKVDPVEVLDHIGRAVPHFSKLRW